MDGQKGKLGEANVKQREQLKQRSGHRKYLPVSEPYYIRLYLT